MLSTKLEETAHALGNDLKSFIRAELDRRFEAVERRFEAIDRRFDEVERRFEATDQRIDSVANELRLEFRADLQSGLRDQLMKFIVIMAAMISVAVAVIKLFPNAG